MLQDPRRPLKFGLLNSMLHPILLPALRSFDFAAPSASRLPGQTKLQTSDCWTGRDGCPPLRLRGTVPSGCWSCRCPPSCLQWPLWCSGSCRGGWEVEGRSLKVWLLEFSCSRVGEGQQVTVRFQYVWDDVDQSLSQGGRHHADVHNIVQLVENRQQIIVAEHGLVSKQTLHHLHHFMCVLWKWENIDPCSAIRLKGWL